MVVAIKPMENEMLMTTLKTFQKLELKSKMVGELQGRIERILNADTSNDKQKLGHAFKQVVHAEQLLKTMYDDLACGQSEIPAQNHQPVCGHCVEAIV